MKNVQISEKNIEDFRLKIRSYSNSAQYNKAYLLAKQYSDKFPHVFYFAYCEAVFMAEETRGLSQKQIDQNFKKAASKLRKLLQKMKGVSARLRRSAKNEYYWFSKQPYKQYRLGLDDVKRGDRSAYYSCGVGAAMLAKKYAFEGKVGLCYRWAKISERSWLRYFKVVPDWYNSYLFYAMSLGLQNRLSEMGQALDRGCQISGLTRRDPIFRKFEDDVINALKEMNIV